MDNAPYHSRMLESVPTMSSRKQQMHDWLTAKGIEYPEAALKRELFQLIRVSNPKPKFVADEMAKVVGHEVVRLPPYHCELNPIELAWSQVKHYIKNNSKLFTLTAVKELTYGGIDQVEVMMEWKKLIEHVQSKFEDKYCLEDGLYEESVDEFIISAGGSDDDPQVRVIPPVI